METPKEIYNNFKTIVSQVPGVHLQNEKVSNIGVTVGLVISRGTDDTEIFKSRVNEVIGLVERKRGVVSNLEVRDNSADMLVLFGEDLLNGLF